MMTLSRKLVPAALTLDASLPLLSLTANSPFLFVMADQVCRGGKMKKERDCTEEFRPNLSPSVLRPSMCVFPIWENQ